MSKPKLLEYHLLSSVHYWFTRPALSDFHRLFGYVLPYGDYSQILLFLIHQFIGYCAMFYLVIATQLVGLLCRLSGSRVQQHLSHSQAPFRDSHPEDSNLIYSTTRFFPLSEIDERNSSGVVCGNCVRTRGAPSHHYS